MSQIQLADGTLFDLLAPDPESIRIETVAHALSHLCRFTGHSRSFYSVAQHCVVVSRLVPTELALVGLLHDAAEAFIGDVSTPLKQLLPEYREIERTIEDAIALAFNLPFLGLDDRVKQADLTALAMERRDLGLPGNDEYWAELPPPAPWAIIPLGPEQAGTLFLARFAEVLLNPGQGQAPIHQQPSQSRYLTNADLSRAAAAAREGAPHDPDTEVIG